MPVLVTGIHVLNLPQNKDVDGRNKSGHDSVWFCLTHDVLNMLRR